MRSLPSGIKYKKCCSIKDIIKKKTCEKCDFEMAVNICKTCEDIHLTRMNCEKQIQSKAFIFGKINDKYGKNYNKFLKSYNKIHGYSDNKQSDTIFDMVTCSKCRVASMMKKTRKCNVVENRTCSNCKEEPCRAEEIENFIKNVNSPE